MGGNEGQNQPVKPRLGVFDAVSIMVGIVIGATIYKTAPDIFSKVPNPTWGIALWVIGGILSLIGALCYAELASTYPRMGGDYVYLSRAFGGWCGFLFGWAQLAVILPASIGAMGFIFAENAVDVMTKSELVAEEAAPSALPPDVQEQIKSIQSSIAVIPAMKSKDDTATREIRDNWTAGMAAGAVLLLTLMNFLGVILGKWVQNLLSLVKVVGLGAIIYIGFSSPAPEPFDYTVQPPTSTNFGLAMVFILYAYGGWNDMAFVAADMKRARHIPRALLIGTTFITLIYVAINVAYIMALGFDEASSQGAPVATRVLSKQLGHFAGKGMSVLVMISALGAINALIFTGSRVYTSLGGDWRLFGWLGRWSPRFGAPIWSLLLQGLITIAMILASGTVLQKDVINSVVDTLGMDPIFWPKYPGGFEILFIGTAPVFWIFFLLTGLSLFALRQRDPNIERPFSVPLFPLLPLIFCTTCMYMLYSSLSYANALSLFGFVPLAVGVPLYYLSGRTTPAESTTAPAVHPVSPSAPVSPPAFVPETTTPFAPESHAPSPFETLAAPPAEPEVPPTEPVPPPDDNPFSFGGKPADVHE